MRPLQQEIIKALKVKPVINPHEEIELSVNFLKDYLRAHSFLKGYVLGISGGQDSTLAGKLAQMAVEQLRQETGREFLFVAVRLPYGLQKDQADAQVALEYIKPDKCLEVNIKSATDRLVEELKDAGLAITDFNKGNIKARQRMVVQYAVAGHDHLAVIGTDHAAESVTGFFTKFGDGAADVLPLWRLNKVQGRQLLASLDCPPELYYKIPVADLEDLKPMESDETALGVTYADIDAYLTGQEISTQAAERIESLYLASRHKRHLPITVFDDFWRS